MAMGMSYDDFWNGDVEMCKFYRKSFELKKKQVNEQLWLQGIYVYKALMSVYPYFNSWSEVKPEPYLDRPIPLTEADAEKDKRDKEKEEMEKMVAYLEGKMASETRKGG